MNVVLKRILIGSGVVVFLLVVFAFTMLPSLVDQKLNPVRKYPPYELTSSLQEVHNAIPFVADLHADTLLWRRDLLKLQIRDHVDVPRLIKANVALQVFSMVTKSPIGQNIKKTDGNKLDQITPLVFFQGWPRSTWSSLLERALYQAKTLNDVAHKSDGILRIIRSRNDLQRYVKERKNRPKVTAGLLALEGGHALEGKLSNLDVLYKAGVRMIGIAHFFDNRLAGSAHGLQKGGLTSLGKLALQRMEKLNILVDLAHLSAKAIDGVLSLARRPVVVSHTGVRGTCPNARNLSDQQIKKIAINGGLIGIGLWEKAVCGKDAMATAKAMRYVADLVGVKHVALGSDFDGTITAPFDVRGLPFLVEALQKLKFKKAEIHQIMGGNVLRLLMESLPAK